MKKIFILLFMMTLFLVVGCEQKTPTLKIEGTYYDKNNMHNGSSLERITLKNDNVAERIVCGADAGCSLFKGTYEIEKNILKIKYLQYQDEFDGWMDIENPDNDFNEYIIDATNTFSKGESVFILEKEVEYDKTNKEYTIELKDETESFKYDKLSLNFHGVKVEENSLEQFYNYTLNIKYDDKNINNAFFNDEKNMRIWSSNMAANFKVYKIGGVYVLVSTLAKQCFSNEVMIFNVNGAIFNTFSNVDIKVDGNKITIEESLDGNCMNTDSVNKYTYEVSELKLNEI